MKRLGWIDGAKAVCIFFVLLAHYDGVPGLSALSTNMMVPAFFFLSGLFAHKDMAVPFTACLARKAKSLLLPYLVFAALNVVVYALLAKPAGGQAAQMALDFLLGRRNHLYAAAMWFIPALFTMALLYRLAFGRLNNRLLRVGVCLLVSAVARLLLDEPMLPLGINQSLRFVCYYALGDWAALHLVESTKWLEGRSAKVLLAAGGCLCVAGAAAFVVWQHYNLQSLCIPVAFLAGCCGCAAAIFLGWPAGRLPFMRVAGAYSMVFCCAETMVRSLVPWALALFGWGYTPDTVPETLGYHGVIMCIIYIVIVLPVRRFAPWLAGKPRKREAAANGNVQ